MTQGTMRRHAKRHLKDILLLFGFPIGIIVLLIGVLYIPRVFAHPTYDFIYCEGYYCHNRFFVGTDGNLQIHPNQNRSVYYTDTNLFYYDVQRDATRPLRVNEATDYHLDASSKSPEGYTLERHSGGGGFLFGGNHRSNWLLKKGIISKPITLGNGSDNTFIGWVVPS